MNKQIVAFKNGNEAAAMAVCQINYHVMGYYPITPSTEIAETLDEMKSMGEHDIVLIPGDGEHGAAGICYGATTAGGRVFNATSAQGLLFSLEQLPVQSGTRYPMVLNLVSRTVSGPLDIRGDHSDVMMALNVGWIIIMAKDAQTIYDFNILAVKLGELKDVRLPVMICFDGFFTSHQKRKINIFETKEPVTAYIGKNEPEYTSVDPSHPVTIGPYMNDPDLINNKKQLSMAMDAAAVAYPEILEEYYRLSGRRYHVLDTYQMEDAEVALFILNSAFDTAKEAVDQLRAEGKKVGVVMPTIIRPFPRTDIINCFKNTKVICVADRQDSYGAGNGNMSLEVKAALKDDPENKSFIFNRIYGLGGKDFYVDDACNLFEEALAVLKTGKKASTFEYYGATPGEENYLTQKREKPLTLEQTAPGILKTAKDEKTDKYEVKGLSLRNLSEMPHRIAPGHGACPGCGIFPALNIILKGIEGHVVVLFHTGCAMVVTTGYPLTAHRVTYIHNLFQNGAPTLSGALEMFKERQRRGELPSGQEITFVMVTGDGGHDIGMGMSIGTALRNHQMIIIEYDNEGYMNTGAQLSYSTPMGHSSSTSNVGPKQWGKTTHHKDTAQILAACHIPYVFTGIETNYKDLIRKAAKAQKISREQGLVFGKVLIACPLNWRSEERLGGKIVQAAVDSNFFPLYEIEKGKTTLSYNPEEKGKKIPVTDWLKLMGKTKHLLLPENKDHVEAIQKEVDRRWERLKAMHAHPLL